MLAWLVGLVLAQPKVSEEITVYGDDFARWDGTRWLVQVELIFPLGLTLARDANRSFDTYAMQLRGVLACDKEHPLSKRKWEVGCTIEDLGLRVTSMRRWRRARDRQMVQEVLDEIDAKLTGAKVQIQTDRLGGVTNVDLEGLEASNQRAREGIESLRQLVARVTAGFHLRIPEHAQRKGEWVEYRSDLMSLPSINGSRGSAYLKHVVTPYEGNQLVQTVGKGTAIASLFKSYLSYDEPPIDGSDDGLGRSDVRLERGEAIDVSFALGARGVAIFDPSTGIMTERVWIVTGQATASAAESGPLPPFRNAGRLTLLGQADRPDVGPSMQVSPPGRTLAGLDPWVSIEVLGD